MARMGEDRNSERGKRIQISEVQDYYAGIITSLSKQEWPNLSTYNDPEIVWRLDKPYHAGLYSVRSTTKC